MAPKAMELIGWPWQHNWAVAWAPTRCLGSDGGASSILNVMILGDLLKISVNHLLVCIVISRLKHPDSPEF